MTTVIGMFPISAGKMVVLVRIGIGRGLVMIERYLFMPDHCFRVAVPSERQSRKEVGKQQNVKHGSFHGAANVGDRMLCCQQEQSPPRGRKFRRLFLVSGTVSPRLAFPGHHQIDGSAVLEQFFCSERGGALRRFIPNSERFETGKGTAIFQQMV